MQRAPNNKYPNCPVLGDSRPLGLEPYMPRCAQQYVAMHSANPTQDSYTARQFLIQNAEDIIKQNAVKAYMNMSCGPCTESDTMLPERVKQVCNERTCTFRPDNMDGLGQGRVYWSEDQDVEVEKKFNEAKKRESDYFKGQGAYYPATGVAQENYSRQAIPSGALLFD